MIRHIILWTLRDELTGEEREAVKANMKSGLEGLVGVVPGLRSVNVYTDALPTSNCDVMLDSALESFEALKAYAIHPAHVEVADTLVRPFTAQRTCLDFEA